MSGRANPPNSEFPLGSRVSFVDAWGERPVEGRVTAHYGTDQIRVEDVDGVVYTGLTWRATAVQEGKPSLSRDEALAKAKTRCASDPDIEAEARAAWERVFARIADRASAKRPTPKVFEVHHEQTVARETLLRAIGLGQSPAEGEAAALAAVGLSADLSFEDMLS